ncbi:transcriptional regulator [Vibrio sp. RE86]|uniref:transcriptional regulator n=1 Tax=Vibrio sp. RE86 TaxID=2607605 RepID=UPI001493AA07|nr:transcriptional regulator [Vibrio sp. RE86]NOH81025.1 transcriptional regulator [Vibrio sp. RE86]
MSISEQYLLKALRETMKQQDLNFSQLSQRCGVPVSSLKRQFHNPSLGIDKITFYANFLNTDIVEIALLAKRFQHQDVRNISTENNEIFSQHPYIFDFAYMLISLKMSVSEIQNKHGLSDASITIYLRVLEMMGYIEVIDHHDIKKLRHSRFYIKEGSALDKLFVKRFKEHQEASRPRPNMYLSRYRLTNQQVEQVETNLYDQINTLHTQNIENQLAPERNIMMSVAEGKVITLADELPEIDGTLLREVSVLSK